MTKHIDISNADRDVEARSAIWKAICIAADDVRNRFQVGSINEIDGVTIRLGSNVPDVRTWRLVEAISLLGVILRSESAKAKYINVFGKTKPIEIVEDGVTHFLWAQNTLKGEKSLLGGRPDLIVTSTPELPNFHNAERIIEAKCVEQLGVQTIRSEFGKAYDLRVHTYFMWSFFTPKPNIIAGARALGITLEELGFSNQKRADLISNPDALISHVAHAQEQARKDHRFAVVLEESGRKVTEKIKYLI